MKKASVTLLCAVALWGCGPDEQERAKRPQASPAPGADTGPPGGRDTGSAAAPGQAYPSPQARRFLRAGRRSCSRARRRAGRVDITVARELVSWSRRAAPAATRRGRELSRLDPPAGSKGYDEFLSQADLNTQIVRRLAQLDLRKPGAGEGAAGLGRTLVRFEHTLERRATRLGLDGCGSLTR